MDVHHVIRPRAQADDAGDDQVGERRVVVIPAAFLAALEPLAGRFIEVFTDVGLAIEAMRAGVGEEGVEIVARRDDVLRIITQDIRERAQRLRSGERPDGAIPFALAASVRAELRMPSLRRGDTERRAETLRAGELSNA